MHGKFGCISSVMMVFREMAEKEIISWNSVLAADTKNGVLDKVFAAFSQMPNPDTISYNELIYRRYSSAFTVAKPELVFLVVGT